MFINSHELKIICGIALKTEQLDVYEKISNFFFQGRADSPITSLKYATGSNIIY